MLFYITKWTAHLLSQIKTNETHRFKLFIPQQNSPMQARSASVFYSEMQNFHKNLVIFTGMMYNREVSGEINSLSLRI